MAHKIILKPGAEEDIDTAYNWYEDQKTGLGEEFLKELIDIIQSWKVILPHSVKS